ncbi:isochorismate synthase [Paracoccus fistulariae]|uniref:isochorismate synthase n=1 Tax=Paracoccus fistulariae TaxID=658446 RepID=A0ABY7SH84_9RHOB|nr:isochorismate synthase [Paracoccus fistulariae]MDB6181834.1 isochorismate synthase [Paracoccus fistulariae]WCR05877.1 isochorismate synthase [Paracoccus fistulariae]
MNSISTLYDIGEQPRALSTVFALSGPRGYIRTDGRAEPVPRGRLDDLPERLARMGSEGVIVGALPFFRKAQDYLWKVPTVSRYPGEALLSDPPAITLKEMRAEPSPALYAASVGHALNIMDRRQNDDALEKVVLARTLVVEADDTIPQDAVFRRIAQDDSITAFHVMLPDDLRRHPFTGRALIGATPELLLEKTGGRIESHPLAGSARRMADPDLDRQARDGLAQSAKDQREHAIVVEYILDTLAPYCSTLGCPQGTALTSTRSMWHLGTLITGELRDPDTPSVLLAAALHPTPAVCGLPCERAANLIGQLEPVERDFYAGAVGWSDLGQGGDGAWYVAIRCADICGPFARLYAGAGIVPGSDPRAEAAETGAKFGAMLQVLGLSSDAGMPPETTEF